MSSIREQVQDGQRQANLVIEKIELIRSSLPATALATFNDQLAYFIKNSTNQKQQGHE